MTNETRTSEESNLVNNKLNSANLKELGRVVLGYTILIGALAVPTYIAATAIGRDIGKYAPDQKVKVCLQRFKPF